MHSYYNRVKNKKNTFGLKFLVYEALSTCRWPRDIFWCQTSEKTV